MAINSSIEWTESSWNPVTGCTKISPGCSNCYAERMARRLQAMNQKNYQNGFQLTLHMEALEKPLLWKHPQLIFVNSMSDLFHEEVPLNFIIKAFKVMRSAKRHTFQILTKRSKRLLEVADSLVWTDNIWMGVSVESSEYLYRVDDLKTTPAKTKFISVEPLLGPLKGLSLPGIDWVIVGGESGPKARPVEADWVKEIRDECIGRGVPFFFKQWGGRSKKKAGRILEGRTWEEMPLSPSMI